MKTKEKLNALKEEVETMSKQLHEMNDEELKQVIGGMKIIEEKKVKCPLCGQMFGYSEFSTQHLPECMKKNAK